MLKIILAAALAVGNGGLTYSASEIATPDEARATLKLKGGDKVAF